MPSRVGVVFVETAMRRTLLPAFVAAALVAVALPSANAAEVSGLPRDTGTPFDSSFDLGFDVSGVGHNTVDARAFLLQMPAPAVGKVLAACAHFLQNPGTIHSPETYAFCSNVIGA